MVIVEFKTLDSTVCLKKTETNDIENENDLEKRVIGPDLRRVPSSHSWSFPFVVRQTGRNPKR